MTLKEFFEKTGMSKRKFAEKLGVSESIICLWVSDKRAPSLKNAVKIEQVTNKKVKIKDLLK